MEDITKNSSTKHAPKGKMPTCSGGGGGGDDTIVVMVVVAMDHKIPCIHRIIKESGGMEYRIHRTCSIYIYYMSYICISYM